MKQKETNERMKRHVRRDGGFLKRISSGSMTVEASVIVPVVVIVAAALIVLMFFVENRNYYTAAACESALAGNERCAAGGSEQAYKAAGTRAEERMDDQPFPGSRPDVKVSCTAKGTDVKYSGQRFPAFSEEIGSYTAEISVDKVRPVKGLRRMRVLKRAAGSG